MEWCLVGNLLTITLRNKMTGPRGIDSIEMFQPINLLVCREKNKKYYIMRVLSLFYGSGVKMRNKTAQGLPA